MCGTLFSGCGTVFSGCAPLFWGAAGLIAVAFGTADGFATGVAADPSGGRSIVCVASSSVLVVLVVAVGVAARATGMVPADIGLRANVKAPRAASFFADGGASPSPRAAIGPPASAATHDPTSAG